MFKKLKDIFVWPSRKYLETKEKKYILIPSLVIFVLVYSFFPDIFSITPYVLMFAISGAYGFISAWIVDKEKTDA